MNKLKIGLIVVGVIIIGILIFYMSLFTKVSSNDEDIKIIIPLGTGKDGIADILKENNIIRSTLGFKIYVKLNNITDFKAGEYSLKQNMSLKEITETLQSGVLYNQDNIDFTYLEGKNIRWLAEKIAETTNNTQDDVYNLLENEQYIDSLIDKYWFITDDIKNKDIYYSLEGYLFPDTYELENEDVTVEEIFGKMLDKMEEVLNEYKDEIENSGLTTHEILTIASIIEMESVHSEDRKDVASVIYNRLDINMAIQSDVTTYYGAHKEIGKDELTWNELNDSNPYNTRLTDGSMNGKLPIGPICNPSITSIEAVLHPSNTNYYYFVANVCTGEVFFQTTSEEFSKKNTELSQVCSGN